MSNTSSHGIADVMAGYPDNVQKIARRVLQLESERLYQDKPHINDDIANIVEEEVTNATDASDT